MMKLRKFTKSDIRFHLKPFKGLTKKYMMECMFNDEIQAKWQPEVGDIIVGCTGNVFVISNKHDYHESLGGTRYFFGGGMCSRDGGNFMNETQSYTMNDDGKYIGWVDGKLTEQSNCYHSSVKDFKFVPYPHETKRL